ncbi:MAG TPA: outer membrane beta-barrel protein [Nitrospiria bacterium]|jgi:hypothetical protein
MKKARWFPSKKQFAIIFFPVFLLFSFQISKAAELKLGPFEIHPYLQISEGFEDNVFRCEACEKESDFFTLITPGLQILLPDPNHHVLLEYRGDFSYYTNFDSENFDDNEVTGEYQGNLTPQLNITVKDHFLDGHDGREVTPLREIDFYFSNRADVEVGFTPLQGVSIQGGFGHFLLDFSGGGRNDFRDRSDLVFSGGATVDIISKTSALLEYSYTKAIYNEQSQSSTGNLNNGTHRVSPGLTWTPSKNSHGKVTAGYALKSFEDSAKDEFDTAIFSIFLEYVLPTKTKISIRGGREVKEPDLDGQDFYITTGGALDVSHPILSVLEGSVSFSGGRESYYREAPLTPGRKRKDNTYRIQTGFDYTPFPWLVAGIDYSFSNTDSNWFSNQFDYINHVVTLKVAVFN